MTPTRALIEAAEALLKVRTPEREYLLQCAISSAKAAEEGVETNNADPLKPSVGLLVKLGSIAVHAEELLSPTGHHFDKSARDTLMQDKEISSWMQNMDNMAFLPKKR